MKKTVAYFIVGMIGVVQCFFCMAEEVTAKKGTGLWGFDLASCEKIQGLIGDTDAHYIEKLCGQSSEELAADIAIMQVVLLKKQLELQHKNVVLDISSDKIREFAQTRYLPEDNVNSDTLGRTTLSPQEAGMFDGEAWYKTTMLGPKLTQAMLIYGNYYAGHFFYNPQYRVGVNSGASNTFKWLW